MNYGRMGLPSGMRTLGLPSYQARNLGALSFSRFRVSFLSDVPAEYAYSWNLRQIDAQGAVTLITFQGYVSPTPAPIPPTVGVNLTGLIAAAQIAAAWSAAFISAGFRTTRTGTDTSYEVLQPFPGEAGNTNFVVNDNFTDALEVNGVSDFENMGFFFYDGQSLVLPAKLGKGFAFLGGTLHTPQTEDLSGG